MAFQSIVCDVDKVCEYSTSTPVPGTVRSTCMQGLESNVDSRYTNMKKWSGTVVLTGMTVLTSRYSVALAIDRLCVYDVFHRTYLRIICFICYLSLFFE